MPTTIDIAPSVGHAVLATQLGVGASPGYDAIDLRRSFANLQEGILATGGWKVSESTPNAMTVDVASNSGRAVVQGDTISDQGLYVVAPHSAVATLTIGANASGSPRIDQIILHVYDTTHDGSGSNKASLEVLAGTATAGATLSNRTGAASLPNTAMRLADVLVASGAATITNSAIRDRRPWARGARWRGVSTGGDISVATSLTEINTSELRARIECSGTLVLVEFAASAGSSGGAAPELAVGPWVDGALPDGTVAVSPNLSVWYYTGAQTGNIFSVNFAYVLNPGAGSHLFSVVAERTGAATILANSTVPAIFSVIELLGAGSANNGTS